jgi:hypothetical protein
MDGNGPRQSTAVNALTVADLDVGLSGGPLRTKDGLRRVHEMLVRTVPSTTEPPLASLKLAASLVGPDLEAIVMSLSPRPRTVFRLLAAGAYEAAWAVLTSNAVGVVQAVRTEASAVMVGTSTRRLPTLTLVEPPHVYADLPGWRDPRYGAPDSSYDISDQVSLSYGLDEVAGSGDVITLGGWARLRLLTTRPDEAVRVVLVQSGSEYVVAGRRMGRAELMVRANEQLHRQSWAGWSADLESSLLPSGTWSVFLELEHCGVVRRAPLGAASSPLALAGTRGITGFGDRSTRWITSELPWCLVVTDDSTTG